MGNVSSSPESPGTQVFYSQVEGVRFRGSRLRQDSTDSDGFTHVPQLGHHVHHQYDRDQADNGDMFSKSDASILSTSPESDEVRQLLAKGQRFNPFQRKNLRIDIPNNNQKLLSSTSISSIMSTSMDESDGGRSLNSSYDFQSDSVSIGGQSMLPNFSPTSLCAKNYRLDSTDEVFTEFDKSKSNSKQKHSTPYADTSSCSRTLSSYSLGDESNIPDDGSMDKSGKFQTSHSLYSFSGDNFGLDSRSPSVDFEINSGVATPDSDLFNTGDVGLNTQADMSLLENDLKDVQREISEMTAKIHRLSSGDSASNRAASPTSPTAHLNLNFPSPRGSVDSPKGSLDLHKVVEKSPELSNVLHVLQRHKGSGSNSTDGSFRGNDSSDSSPCRKEMSQRSSRRSSRGSEAAGGRNSVEFMWDYRSDLAAGRAASEESSRVQSPTESITTTRNRKLGLTNWGTLDDSSVTSPAESAYSDASHLRRQFGRRLPSQSPSLTSFDLTPDPSRPGSVSVNDLYIDDDLSALASQESTDQMSFDIDDFSMSDIQSVSEVPSIESSAHVSPSHGPLSPGDPPQEMCISDQSYTLSSATVDAIVNSQSLSSLQSYTADNTHDSFQNGNNLVPSTLNDTSDVNNENRTTSNNNSTDATRDTNMNFEAVINPSGQIQLNIGPKVNLIQYAEREWKGTTKTAQRMKQVGFEIIYAIPEKH